MEILAFVLVIVFVLVVRNNLVNSANRAFRGVSDDVGINKRRIDNVHKANLETFGAIDAEFNLIRARLTVLEPKPKVAKIKKTKNSK